MVVGEAPGRQEAETGKPFQGKAGQLLRQLLNDVEIDPEEVYISNHVKCRPPENRTPTTTELKACRPYLDTEIETVNPKFVLLLGATAAKLINKTKIASSHGRPFEKNGRTYFVTYHPAAALRDPSRLPTLKSDLRQFSNLVKGITARDDFRWAAVTKRNLNQFLAEFQAARSFAFDLETSQLDPMLPGAAIRCMGIALPTGMNWVIPLTSERSDFEVHEAQQEVMELLVRLSKGKICVGHHGKFDNKWLKAEYGVSFNRTDDTIMLAHLIDENQPINLEYQSQLHLGAPAYDIPLKEKTQWEYSERRLEYCARDVYYTLQLRGVLLEKVRKESHTLDLYRKLMMPISRVFEDIELRGLYIDIEQKEITRKELQKQMNKTLLQLNKMAGERINWNSSAQVGRLLFGKLGLPVLAKTDKGQPSTAEAVLKELDHPIMDLLMKYRELGKQLSTYVEGWDSFMVGPHLYLSTNLNGTVCFTEDTLVDTSRGVLPFPQVKVGDRVLTHTGHWQPVLEKVVNGTKEVFRVTLTNGLVLDTTGNHPYLTPAGWVEADQLKPGTLVTSYGAPEIWRPIRGWEDLYEVSSWGRVRHLPSGITRGKYRIIKSRVRAREGTGRPVITLNRGSSANRKDGTAKDFYVHRLVAHHFIDNPRSLSEVRHLDGRVWNNRVENLAWGTCSDNRRGERYKYTETTNEWKYPFELSAVQSVTRLGKQFTYGLVVAEDHSHVTNGILTHNTGRFSSRLHQVPRDPLIRSLFIAPPGWVMVVADFSQQELRIAAHLSQDPAMLLVFQTGGDIHSQTAREVLGNPDPTKEQRKAAKAVNFGFIYGMWWKKFKKYAKEKYGIILTDAESEQYRAAFFRRYNRLLAWHKKQRALVKADGKVINLAGRTRHLPGVWSTDREIQQEAERQAINTVVQGFGGDMKVMSMIEIDATFDETVLQLLGEVHDSVLMWVKEEHLEETLPEVKRIMEHPALMDELGIHLSVPVVVDIEVGPWGKGKAWTPPGLQGS